MFAFTHPGQGNMTPFTGYIARAVHEFFVEHHCTTTPRPKDNAEHRSVLVRRPVYCFGQGKAVGIIGKADLSTKPVHQIFSKRLAIQPS